MAVKNVLFVCIGNSCRSPMAEAFANKLGESRIRAWSAGVYPLGWIEPNTRLAMEEIGISLDGQSSKGISEVSLDNMDIIVSMGSAGLIALPADLQERLVAWNVPDPIGASLDRYRSVRDLIEAKVRDLIATLSKQKSDSGKR